MTVTEVEATPGPDDPNPGDPRTRWIDNHCHLDGDADAAEQVAEARSAGVVALINVGTSAERSAAGLALAAELDHVWATAGVHTHDATDGVDGLRRLLAGAAADPFLVAIGECGLDYHYDHSPRDVQRSTFAAQVQLAHQMNLPLVIHTREAWDDTFDVLAVEGVPPRTVFHCFTGGPVEAERALATGAMLSISGIVTFAGATELRQAVASAPLERLMVETDAPYLAPVPHRGQRNRPALVARVGDEVARLQGRSAHEVAAATTATATDFYGLGAP